MLGGYRYQSIRTGLVGHWRPSRGPSGLTLIDPIRGNHGTLTNGPTWTPSAGGGSGGYAINFDGTDDFVDIPSVISPTDFPITLSAWFRTTSSTATQCIVSFGHSTFTDRHIGIYAGGAVAGDPVQLITRNSATSTANTSVGYSVNTWTLATGVIYSNTDKRVYLNGSSEGIDTTSVTIPTTTANSIGRLLRTSAVNFFLGSIDDVAVWSRPLSQAEIFSLYQAGRGALDQRVNVTVVRGATTSTGTGSASITEANDTVSSTATIAIAATASITESSDTVSCVSTIALRATAGITEASDTVASASTIALRATLSVTETSDTCVGASTITSGITGTTGATEADDTLSSASTIALRATAGITEANDTVTSTSTLLLRAVLAVTEASDSLSSASTISDVGLPPQIDGSPYAAWYVQNTEAW